MEEEPQKEYNYSDHISEHTDSEISWMSEDDYVPEWILRKRENYKIYRHDFTITKQDLEWLNSSSEEEMEKKVMIQNRLKAKTDSKNVLENWNKKKQIWEKLRPKKNPRKFPVPRETITTVVNINSYDETIVVEQERLLTNEEIFKKLPDYFRENPFFVDLSEKFQNNWFTVREGREVLKKEAGIEEKSFAQALVTAGEVLKEKTKKNKFMKSINRKSSGSESIESSSSEKNEIIEKEIEEKKTEVEVGKEKDSVGSNKNQPMDMDTELDGALILDAKTRRNILKNAAIFHQEFGLKASKIYFLTWKRAVDKINEKKFIKAQQKEDKRGKKITEKSLIKRENKVDIAKKKQKSKELYYKGEATEFKLVHALPKKLDKFIKNCNDIYKIV